MRKFQFNLEKLLSYKGQMLDSELMALAVLYNLIDNAREDLTLLQNDIKRCRSEFLKKVSEKTTSAACNIYLCYEKSIKDQIKQKEKEIESLKVQVDKQIEIIKNLKMETRSMEIIKDSRFEDYKKDFIKETELQTNEFVSTVFSGRSESNVAF